MGILTKSSLATAIEELAARDADLAGIVEVYGPPPFWSRPRGFATLVYIIFEQQVSLASGKATYEKVAALLDDFSPVSYLRLGDEALRGAGVSRQKMRYTRLVAEAICDGSLPITTLGRLPDRTVRELLTAITGIGNWTADIYLMVALRRPDLWPVGDLALVKAVQSVKGLPHRPAAACLDALGERYRPYRSVATRIYWRHYLHA
jgi:DNA-3-methyladenine glycosylase II